jgi:hypothetical protein
MTAVAEVNQSLLAAFAEINQGATGDLVEKLKMWIERLVAKLTEIVKQLATGTSFSISVGPLVSVTVNFPAP